MGYCKKCYSELQKTYRKNPDAIAKEKARKKNPEYIKKAKEYKKRIYQENRQRYIDKATRRNKEHREERNVYLAEYRKINRERIREISRKSENKLYTKNYYQNPNYRLRKVLRARIRKVVISGRFPSTEYITGCSMDELRVHLENHFTPQMSWDNHGKYWHIDHIKPCASFDLSKEEEQKKCFHYSNLRPLPAIENMRKGAKLDYYQMNQLDDTIRSVARIWFYN